MTKTLPLLLSALALSASVFTAKPASAQNLGSLFGTPVAFQYNCGTATGTLPVCTTNFTIPSNRRLVIQNVSGSATPITPNAAGNFGTNQASLTVSTQIFNSAPIANIIGPNYAIANTNTWFFNTLVVLVTDNLPTVSNNGGPVYVQGYLTVR